MTGDAAEHVLGNGVVPKARPVSWIAGKNLESLKSHRYDGRSLS
jgi:hypothetical protein